jgi:hypothetical protein
VKAGGSRCAHTRSMETGAGSDADRYRDVAQRLHAIAKPMRVLSALRWPASVRDEFLAGGGDTLPSVEYPSFDEQPMVEAVRDVRRSIYPGELIDDWLESTAGAIELTARLLAARGTEAFLDYGRALYGTPQEARETSWATGTKLLPLTPRMAGSSSLRSRPPTAEGASPPPGASGQGNASRSGDGGSGISRVLNRDVTRRRGTGAGGPRRSGDRARPAPLAVRVPPSGSVSRDRPSGPQRARRATSSWSGLTRGPGRR